MTKPRQRKILLIRLSAIGDVVTATCLLPILKAHWPNCKIDWLVDSANRELLEDNPLINRLICWPRGEWLKLWRNKQYRRLIGEYRAFKKELQKESYHLTLDTQGLLKSGLWGWLANGEKRIGLGSREGTQYLMDHVISRKTEGLEMGSEYLKLARQLEAKAGSGCMALTLGETGRVMANRQLKNLSIDTPFIVFAPFTTRPQKHWFPENWSELAGQLYQQTGLPILLLGGPGDAVAAETIIEATDASLFNLAGQLSLGGSAALIGKSALLVGVDTGMTHIGMALERPTIALFGATRPYLSSPNPLGRILYNPMDCSPCRWRPSCDGTFDCMRHHTVTKVHNNCLQLLKGAPLPK